MSILGTSPKTSVCGFKLRHLAMIVVILSVLVLGLHLFVENSDAYEDAVQFARTNAEVTKRIGKVSEVSLNFWDGFHVTYSGGGGDAAFVLALRGEREEAVLDVRLMRIANSWRVENAYLSSKSEKGVSVSRGAGVGLPSRN